MDSFPVAHQQQPQIPIVEMYTLIILFFFLSICASFLCSVLEAVLLSISPAFVERQSNENPSVGKPLAEFQENIDRPLAAILTLNTIAHTVGAIGVGAQAAVIWGDSFAATIVIPVVMTLAILILSEIIPKTLGAIYWQELAAFTVRTLKIILFLLGPLVLVSQFVTRLLLKGKDKSVLSRADFSAMAELGAREGVFDERESSLLRNFMRFDSVRAKDVMTPRTVVVAAQEDQTLSQFHEEHPTLRFSRIPLFTDSKDHVTGYFMRDDLLAALVDNKGSEPLSSLRRELSAVQEQFPIPELFTHFTNEHSHIAMVVDEFGGMAGLVTMEDVIETLLGMEIVDEVDGEADMQVLARRQWERRAERLGLIEHESDVQGSTERGSST
jgi:CBS domain containing-hemolysin-like protein